VGTLRRRLDLLGRWKFPAVHQPGADGVELLKSSVQHRSFHRTVRDEMGTVQPETEAHLGALVISIWK
jgi:hypothetical protein